LTDMAIDTVES